MLKLSLTEVLFGHCFAIPCQHVVDFAFAKSTGALAQLGEHLLCKQGVIGSIPIRSTIIQFVNELNAATAIGAANCVRLSQPQP